ncbi:MAG: hypothetical protein Q9160_005549 [Pyrenula sp. 1 TL-2023]
MAPSCSESLEQDIKAGSLVSVTAKAQDTLARATKGPDAGPSSAVLPSEDISQKAVSVLLLPDVGSKKHPSDTDNPSSHPDGPPELKDGSLVEQATDSADEKSSTAFSMSDLFPPESTLPFYKRWLAKCSDRWAWEILGCLLAVACLIAIVIVLAVHQDLPIPHWPNMISINSWVSIFTAIMKAAIMLPIAENESSLNLPRIALAMSHLKWLSFRSPRALMDTEDFDSASRGPWGALFLLFSLRGSSVASFGAFLTVVALAIDPFSQQIIQYYNCFPVAHDAFAAIPRTNSYTNDGIAIQPGYSQLNEAASTAVFMGALDAPISERALIPFVCSSGNCTFPNSGLDKAAFQTLGMCHSCKEINGLIRVNKTYPGYWLENWEGQPSWNWSDQPANVGYVFPNTSLPYSLFWSRKTLALDPAFDDLVTFDWLMLNVDPGCNVEISQHCPKHPWAVRCSIYPCIQTYSATIVNSILQETILSTIPIRKTNTSAVEITTSPNLTYSLVTDEKLRNGTWNQCKVSKELTPATPVPISVNKTLAIDNSNASAPLQYYERDCVWSIGYLVGLGFNQILSQLYDREFFFGSTENTFQTVGPGQLKYLYRNGTANLSSTNEYLSRLTGTLTAIVRQRGDSGPDRWAFGHVLESRTCVGVKWAWLSLPALLVVLSIAFVIATAVHASRAGMWTGAWKSSAVAPIILAVNGSSGTADHIPSVGGAKSYWKTELEWAAKHLCARVSAKEGRLAVMPLSMPGQKIVTHSSAPSGQIV